MSLNAFRFRLILLLLSSMLISTASASALELESAGKKQVIANVPYWDQENAFSAVIKHIDVITDVSPWWYAPAEGGTVEVQDKEHVRIDNKMLIFLHARGVRIMPVIANHRNGSWDTRTITQILHDPAIASAHIQAIEQMVKDEHYDGIIIDYEELKKTDRQAFSHFIEMLGNTLHAEKKLLYVFVHPKDSDAGYDERNKAQDYASLGHSADRVIIMIYDWHWSTSAPGPIAPITWVENVIRWSVSQIPADKVIQGIGLYGYDWVGNQAQDKTWKDIMATVNTYGAYIQFDNVSMSPWFHYESNSTSHDVWFENMQSLTAKLALKKKYNLAGCSLWRLGGEQPEIWVLF